MSNLSAEYKQQSLIKHVLRALKKIELELQQYQITIQATQSPHDANVQSGQTHQSLEHVDIDPEVIINTSELEKLLLERISFFEKWFLTREQYIQEGDLPLLKRAILTLKYMQTILEQYKRAQPAMPTFPQNLSNASATEQKQVGFSGTAHISAKSHQTNKKVGSQLILHHMSQDQSLPLSFAQQRLWFLHHLEPDSSTYTIAGEVDLQGQLHIEALEQSLNEVIRRHAVLRTSFTEYNESLVQNVVASTFITLPVVDLQRCSSNTQKTEIKQLFSAEAQHPFDLQQVPLIRGSLLYLNKQEYKLLLMVHHIAFDGWSLEIFLRELIALYRAFSQGETSPLRELPIQYADYAQWQREWLRGGVLEQLVDYWRKSLAGVPTELVLPTDQPRSSSSSSAGATYIFNLPGLHTGLHRLAQQESVTLFMLLLATFQVMLYRWSGQEDFVIGTDIANRTQVETEELIGFFVNLLALRTKISGSVNFQSYLQQVREQVLAAYVHQALPFEKLIEALHIQRTENQVPLIQVLFVLQNTPVQCLELPGLTLTVREVPIAQAKFDLAMFIEERAQGLAGTVTYRTALFKESTIQRMVGWFETLLVAIMEQPQESIDTLQIYTRQEQEQFSNEEKVFNEEKGKKFKVTRRKTIQIIR